MEEADSDENLASLPLSTWSHDCGLIDFRCVSLQDSEGKKVLMGHNRLSKSQISTVATRVLPNNPKLEEQTKIIQQLSHPQNHKTLNLLRLKKKE